MADIQEGAVFNFTVVAKNAAGRQVAVSDAAVSLDNAALGTVSVNPDGTGGVFQAGSVDGDGTLTPSAAGVTGTPFAVSVKQDNVVVSVEIVEDPVQSVTIVPA